MGSSDRRLKYALLGQFPEERRRNYSAARGGAVADQACYYGDQRPIQAEAQQNRASEGSIKDGYYVPPLEEGVFRWGDGAGEAMVSTVEGFGRGGGGGSSSKSWAQHTVESYQMQLALALRLSSEAGCANDPNSLDFVLDESASRVPSSSNSAEAISHRFWVNGSLSYSDKLPPGFYSIHGMGPRLWAVCSDPQESGVIPSLESLKSVEPTLDSSVEVISVDQQGDSNLKDLQNRILEVSFICTTTLEIVDLLAKLVCNHMGGAAPGGEDELITIWRQCSNELQACLGSIVLPIGSLPVGLCRHRSLLFKALADFIGLQCRIAKGCRYCTREDASSCLIRLAVDREHLIDLIEKPGCLYDPDSLLNGLSTISVSSPLHCAQYKQVEHPVDFRLLAKQYLLDFQSLDIVFNDSLPDTGNFVHPEQMDRTREPRMGPNPNTINQGANYFMPPIVDVHYNPDLLNSKDTAKGSAPLKLPPIVHRDAQPLIKLADTRESVNRITIPSESSVELSFDIEDMNIPWSDLVLREKIGSGSFGTVHRAEWNGCDVAVKILMEQDFDAERVKEFSQEVALMKRLRHPNIVLFMGAVTEPPNLSIVTEYLAKGSLYRLLHKPGAREILDERRRLSMAYDVAKGMNYLHKCNPPIVHRDLKSPNLLVDDKYTVKVCDFGLSRLKANTFLSSKSAAGTPEWMAPEVIRNDQSDEKSDVYSFGVILWELTTLQKPWAELNSPQVIAAVYEGKRLSIPRTMNPRISALIQACWIKEPSKRPSFSIIMDSLRALIESSPTTQPGRPLLV